MDPIAPWTSIVGGLLIGSAAALFLLLNGRVAGVSGLLATTLRIGGGDTPRSQAAAFIIGLPLGGAIVIGLIGTPEISVTKSIPLLVGSGLLVGFGTRLGNGCTSGHGVCGMARLSRRSIAATLVFMGTAAATVFFVRHMVGA